MMAQASRRIGWGAPVSVKSDSRTSRHVYSCLCVAQKCRRNVRVFSFGPLSLQDVVFTNHVQIYPIKNAPLLLNLRPQLPAPPQRFAKRITNRRHVTPYDAQEVQQRHETFYIKYMKHVLVVCGVNYDSRRFLLAIAGGFS